LRQLFACVRAILLGEKSNLKAFHYILPLIGTVTSAWHWSSAADNVYLAFAGDEYRPANTRPSSKAIKNAGCLLNRNSLHQFNQPRG